MIIHFVRNCKNRKDVEKDRQILDENDSEAKNIDKIYINEIKQNLKDALMLVNMVDKSHIDSFEV
jgi:uncharacterized protein YnzC (UPF0291/DUF896 family)